MAEARLTALKIGYKGEIHRLRVDLASFNLEELSALFAETFGLPAGSFVVQYSDPEGDLLSVCSEAEFAEACRVFLSNNDAVKSLRFVAASRTQVAFQENVADPILKAIEKLVETLNAAMEKVKHEQWAQRAATQAQTGFDATKTVLHRAALDARESFVDARQSIQEIPFDQLLKETTEGIKSAAEGISVFAKEVVGEIKNFQYPAQAATVVPETEVTIEVEETNQVAPVEVAEATPVEVAQVSSGSDSEWEEVAEQAPVEVAAPVEEAPVVVEVVAPVVSEEELKWAAEISLVRSIFPDVQAAQVIERLEQCNGNVEVVVNALMEEM